MSTEKKLPLIRKGSELRDPSWEKCIAVPAPNANRFLPAILSEQKFVVPKKNLRVPIDFEGKPIKAQLHGNQGEVLVLPHFRLAGVEEGDGGRRLVAALYHSEGYESQIVELRSLLDGIFRSFLGHNPKAEELEKIAAPHSARYDTLCGRVRDELGMEIGWTLQPEPKTAVWLAKLIEVSPQTTVISYNEEVPDAEFKLGFSVFIERASIVHQRVLERRASRGLSPDQEFQHLFQRVFDRTNSAFRSAFFGPTVWNAGLLRAIAADGFASVVSRMLTEELGYEVRFADFSPKLSAARLAQIEKVNPQRIADVDFEHAESVVLDLKALRRETLRNHEGDYSKVAEIDTKITRAEEELEKKRAGLMAGPEKLLGVLEAVKPAMLEDLQAKFRGALLLEDKAREQAAYGGGRS